MVFVFRIFVQMKSTVSLTVWTQGCSFVDYSVYFLGEACGVWICTVFKWWMECGRVKTHSVEAVPSCQMFSAKPKCTVRFGFPFPTFSAGCICTSVGVYLSGWVLNSWHKNLLGQWWKKDIRSPCPEAECDVERKENKINYQLSFLPSNIVLVKQVIQTWTYNDFNVILEF